MTRIVSCCLCLNLLLSARPAASLATQVRVQTAPGATGFSAAPAAVTLNSLVLNMQTPGLSASGSALTLPTASSVLTPAAFSQLNNPALAARVAAVAQRLPDAAAAATNNNAQAGSGFTAAPGVTPPGGVQGQAVAGVPAAAPGQAPKKTEPLAPGKLSNAGQAPANKKEADAAALEAADGLTKVDLKELAAAVEGVMGGLSPGQIAAMSDEEFNDGAERILAALEGRAQAKRAKATAGQDRSTKDSAGAETGSGRIQSEEAATAPRRTLLARAPTAPQGNTFSAVERGQAAGRLAAEPAAPKTTAADDDSFIPESLRAFLRKVPGLGGDSAAGREDSGRPAPKDYGELTPESVVAYLSDVAPAIQELAVDAFGMHHDVPDSFAACGPVSLAVRDALRDDLRRRFPGTNVDVSLEPGRLDGPGEPVQHVFLKIINRNSPTSIFMTPLAVVDFTAAQKPGNLEALGQNPREQATLILPWSDDIYEARYPFLRPGARDAGEMIRRIEAARGPLSRELEAKIRKYLAGLP